MKFALRLSNFHPRRDRHHLEIVTRLLLEEMRDRTRSVSESCRHVTALLNVPRCLPGREIFGDIEEVKYRLMVEADTSIKIEFIVHSRKNTVISFN